MGCKFLVDKTGRYDAPEIPTTLTIPSSIPFNYNILISKINNQYLNLINIIGTGQNKSFIIIDFLTKKNSFAFQYNWNYQVIETSETIIQNLEPEPEPELIELEPEPETVLIELEPEPEQEGGDLLASWNFEILLPIGNYNKYLVPDQNNNNFTALKSNNSTIFYDLKNYISTNIHNSGISQNSLFLLPKRILFGA